MVLFLPRMSARTFISSLTIHYLAFSMALDYSIVLLSVEELWISLGGNMTMYGFVFGIYALSQAVSTPVLSYISDLRGLKFTLMLSLIINSIGNMLYGVSFLAKSVNLVLVGRFVAGLGAGSASLGVIYLTNVTSREMRGKAIASFKLSQAFGFFGGPVIGLAFTTLKNPELSPSAAAKTFNLYTFPAWLGLLNVLVIAVPAIKLCFKNPLAPHMALRYNHREAKELLLHTALFVPFLVLASTSYWLVTSDLFTLAFGQYHLLRSNKELWKVYVSAGIVLVLTCIIIRLTIHIKHLLSPVVLTVVGLLVSCAGYALLGDYNIKNTIISEAFYYGASALVTSGGTAFFTGSGTYYSRKVTDLSHQARNRRGLFLGLFMFGESFGRFLGPSISSVIAHIDKDPNFKTLHKCDLINLVPDGCHVTNVNVTLITLSCVTIVLTACFIWYHRKYGKCQVDVSLLSLEELPIPQPNVEFNRAHHEITLHSEVKLELNVEVTRPRSSTSHSLTSTKSSHSLNNNISLINDIQ